MTIFIVGPKRPKLSLHYGRTNRAPMQRRPATLSSGELQRIVAEMVG